MYISHQKISLNNYNHLFISKVLKENKLNQAGFLIKKNKMKNNISSQKRKTEKQNGRNLKYIIKLFN